MAREGTAVERCHAIPHSMRYSVGHHSADLAALVAQCWMEDHGGAPPSGYLLMACLFHDVPEGVTGDIGSPIKDRLGHDLTDRIEQQVMRRLGLATLMSSLSSEERRYLHVGDHLELTLWCVEEAGRGHTGFLRWAAGYCRRYAPTINPADSEMSAPIPPSMRTLFAELFRMRLRYEFVTTWDRLKELDADEEV